MYGKVYNQVISFKFNVGDLVRFREFKDMRFDKGYVENYSEEVFTVIERVLELERKMVEKWIHFIMNKNYWLLIEIRIHSI